MSQKDHITPSGQAPPVYVLVLNWNNYEDTARCVESLNKLDYPNYRVLVIDNGSTDGSAEQLRERFNEIEILETGHNLGFAGGNNKGIEYALGHGAEYVWLLNNDTVVDDRALNALMKAVKHSDEIGIAGSSVYKMNDRNRVEAFGGGHVRFPTAQLIPNTGDDSMVDLDYVTGASMLIKREVIEKAGLLDDAFFMYWEDIEFTGRAREHGYRAVHAPGSKVYHREHGSIDNAGGFTRREYLFAKGTVLFYKKQIPYWPLVLTLAYAGKMINRLMRLEFKNMRAVSRGFWDGLRD